ncbi:hypothetical protein, partial [Mesorhizobium sp. M0965]|uniref:DedA family protein n=1 Tax=Mesorhizobium sp. M0965 TaxID=2957036 RepID=UPI003335E658
MSLDEVTQATIAFIRTHEAWGVPLVLVLAFGESLAFISLLLPATVILIGVGFLIGESGIAFWPLWLAAAIGAALGDWLSFWIGTRLGNGVSHYWPLSRYPNLIRAVTCSSSDGGWPGCSLGASSVLCAHPCHWRGGGGGWGPTRVRAETTPRRLIKCEP